MNQARIFGLTVTGTFAGLHKPRRAGIDQCWILCYYPYMKSNKRYKENDPVHNAVVDKMTEKGKGFFIISCGPWIHPLNKVLNCYVIMFDGFVQYKFELKVSGYEVAEIRSTEWLALRLTVGETLTQERLIQKIQEG